MAAFPQISAESLFSGQFGQDFEVYLLDRFPLRNAAVALTSRFENLISLASHEDYLLIAEDVKDPLVEDLSDDAMEDLLAEWNSDPTEPAGSEPVTEPQDDPVETLPTDPQKTTPEEDPPILPKPPVALNDLPSYCGIFLDTGSGPEYVRSYERANVAAFTTVLNRYAELLPENGKLLFTVGPPSQLVNRFAGAEHKVGFYSTWDEAVNALGSDNVYAFDSCEILADGVRRGEYVSFRTDNHWTPYGAYLVYCELASQAGKTLCSYPDDFTITS